MQNVTCRFLEIPVIVELIHLTSLAGQNASKQRMTKYHPQKSLNNNARFVVKGVPP